MKWPIKERALTGALVIPTAIVVVVLAALQYRWSNQISEATSVRLADSLQMSLINWHLDFFRDFSEICFTLRVDPARKEQDDLDQYARLFTEWKAMTAHPDLVSNLYVLQSGEGSEARVSRLNPSTRRFEPDTWPSKFAGLDAELRRASSDLVSSATDANFGGDVLDLRTQSALGDFANRFLPGSALSGWRFAPEVPALVHPIGSSGAASKQRQQTGRDSLGWILLELNPKAIRDEILPDLAQRYFRGTEGLDYQVAVVAGRKPGQLIYSSDAGFGSQEVKDADGTMDIFGRLEDPRLASPIRIFHSPSENKGPAASVGISWFPLLHEIPAEQDWRLVVRHRRGGALGAFVADSRRRDLAISFGVLFLLVVSMALLIITSMRAQRLAKLQMDFVTAVSHELRTPLAVISSAADNIAHGVVEGKQQLTQYGSVIANQASKLYELVEQILLFAAIRGGHQRYTLRPLVVHEVVAAALTNTAGLIHAAQFTVEQDIEQNLPGVQGDLTALSQCLQNLITNALKYGSEKRWMGIRVRVTEHGLGGREIQISVSDRGLGISSADLPHIFEPFYRSPSVTAAQIHGTGLGLPLAKSIAQAMNGDLTVNSTPGRGSTFTLHLPCLERDRKEAEVAVSTPVTS